MRRQPSGTRRAESGPMGGRRLEEDSRFSIRENFLINRCTEIGWAVLGGRSLPIPGRV